VRLLVVEKVDYLDDFLAAPVSIPTDGDIVPREDSPFDLLRALF
jgi:hypothetical protein